MNFETSEKNNHIIVALHGRIDVHMATELEAYLNDLIEKHPTKNLVLNLSDVEYMSSSGLRVFVSVMRQLKEKNRQLKLTNLSLPVKRVFEVVELMDMFHIYEDEADAIA
ncbi:MAG: STAS domain-containing protein [Leptospiraceae bacterium]|nr:STAS domain-containing protein [Leptospiraceae bacterium]MDW7975354.1 STAS domain-containing protein [Leptospiraceae bacterium]